MIPERYARSLPFVVLEYELRFAPLDVHEDHVPFSVSHHKRETLGIVKLIILRPRRRCLQTHRERMRSLFRHIAVARVGEIGQLRLIHIPLYESHKVDHVRHVRIHVEPVFVPPEHRKLRLLDLPRHLLPHARYAVPLRILLVFQYDIPRIHSRVRSRCARRYRH